MKWNKFTGVFFSEDGIWRVKKITDGMWTVAKLVDGKWTPPNMKCQLSFFLTAKSAKEYVQELAASEV
jgi:hypothetical protein